MAPWDAPSAFRGGDACTGGADALSGAAHGDHSARRREGTERRPLLARAGRLFPGRAVRPLRSLPHRLLCPRCHHVRLPLVSRIPGLRPSPTLFADGRIACIFPWAAGRARTRNPLLKTVGENTEALYRHCRALGIPSIFRYHPGNHYGHAVERTADGIAWLLNPDAAEDAPAL